MLRIKLVVFLSCFCLFNSAQAQPNCNGTSTGLIPINDLGSGTFNGWVGGLYPGGSNYLPALHKTAGMNFASQVVPLNTAGLPDTANGKIVWLSVGFSNTTQEASAFIPLASSQPDLNPFLQLIDGAQGSQTAAILSTPSNPGYAPYWSTVAARLANAGASANQVQIVWYKDDNPAGTTPLQTHYDSLLEQSVRIMNELKNRFPNVKLCYISSRIYAGYASTGLNPEPYAYRNGWAMKHLIEAQINGDPRLQYNGAGANAPWLSWGVYQWADGLTPRSDGLTWVCPDDYQNDGTHPSVTGRQKVAALMLDFYRNDSTTCPWFLNNCSINTGLSEVTVSTGSEIRVFPIPFQTRFTISLPATNTEQVLVQIHDMSGRRVLNQIMRPDMNGNLIILLPEKIQRTGIYLLEIKTTDRTWRQLISGN